MKFLYETLKKIDTSLGKHNDALYAVLAIAVFKGVMRPTFTMMDKDSDPKTKKYAAFREGLTEAIAFASYVVTHALVNKLAKPICEKTNSMEKLSKVKNGLSIFSVCLTAGLIIPAVCNLTLKPIMDAVTKAQKNKKAIKEEAKIGAETEETPVLNIKETAVNENATVINPVKPAASSGSLLTTLQNTAVHSSRMKVGG